MGAVALSWVLMIIYITIRFEHNFAFAAIIALIIDVMVTLSWFSLLQLEMDSSFVAALLTVVGYSINGTIVIFRPDPGKPPYSPPQRKLGGYGG